MKFNVPLHGFAVLAMAAAILVATSLGKTMYASVTGWGGGHSLNAAYDITTESIAETLRSAAPLHAAAPASTTESNPYTQLTLALLLILGGYALEVIRQEHVLQMRVKRRR